MDVLPLVFLLETRTRTLICELSLLKLHRVLLEYRFHDVASVLFLVFDVLRSAAQLSVPI